MPYLQHDRTPSLPTVHLEARACGRNYSYTYEQLVYQRGNVRIYADGERMRVYKESYPELATDSRNLVLGGCGDGVSPFDKARKSLSMMCFVFTVFNLPQQIRDKYDNLLVWGIFEGIHNKHVHVHKFLAEDLKHVSHGIDVFDSFQEKSFKCVTKVLTLTADQPGLGELSQQKGVTAKAGCYKCSLLGTMCSCLKKNLYALKLQGEAGGARAPLTRRSHASITYDSDAIVVSTHTTSLPD